MQTKTHVCIINIWCLEARSVDLALLIIHKVIEQKVTDHSPKPSGSFYPTGHRQNKKIYREDSIKHPPYNDKKLLISASSTLKMLKKSPSSIYIQSEKHRLNHSQSPPQWERTKREGKYDHRFNNKNLFVACS